MNNDPGVLCFFSVRNTYTKCTDVVALFLIFIYRIHMCNSAISICNSITSENGPENAVNTNGFYVINLFWILFNNYLMCLNYGNFRNTLS